MIRNDLIMRMVQQLVEVLLRAAGLRRKKDLQGAQDAVGDGLGSLGVSLALLRSLSPDTLRSMLSDPIKVALVSASCEELARIARAHGNEIDANIYDALALDLLAGVDEDKLPPEARDLLDRGPL